jgi:DNA invertase Pin-like site-specific DNA recombinase
MSEQQQRQPMNYGYVRVSTARQAREGVGLDAQTGGIEAHYQFKLRAEGFAWGGHFIDDGVSGKTPLRDRPGGAQLFAALEKGDCVTFLKLDRAFRSVLDMLETLKLLDLRGVRVVFL